MIAVQLFTGVVFIIYGLHLTGIPYWIYDKVSKKKEVAEVEEECA